MASTQGIKLDESIRARLRALGEIRNRSAHWLMRTAIESYLEREEQYEREKSEDREEWEHYQLTGEAVAHDTAAQWLRDLAQGDVKPCPR